MVLVLSVTAFGPEIFDRRRDEEKPDIGFAVLPAGS
jgi:hypothetical protein